MQRIDLRIKTKLMVGLLLFFGIAKAETYTLTVNNQLANQTSGQVLCALYHSADTFLTVSEALVTQQQVFTKQQQVQCVFDHLTAGNYAVTVVLDRNLNGKLDTNWLGIPTEPVGLSNNAKTRFGPPSYEDAQFQLSAHRTLSITLTHVE